MKKWCSKASQIRSEEYGRGDVDWELRPGGMIVQKRHVGSGSDPNVDRFIRINISHGSYRHQITIDSHSTFGDLKTVLRQQTGLEPREQRLLFKGKEKENDEWLHMAGVNDMSKLILMEDPATKERKLEEMKKKKKNTSAAGEALAQITAEVDKLSEKVAAVEGGVNGGKRVEEKEVNLLTELLMIQLLKLDAIETNGDSKLQRRTQVVRVQKLVDTLDNLKATISNPLNQRVSSATTTKWEAFEYGFGSLIPPTSKLTISSTKITHDWELFD